MKWPVVLESVPTRVTAMRWTGDNAPELRAWGAPVVFWPDLWLWVAANGAQVRLEVGEWIFRDELGYYPCKHEIKTRKYREVTDGDFHAATDR